MYYYSCFCHYCTFEDVAAAKVVDQLFECGSFNNIKIQMAIVLNNKNKRLLQLNSLGYFKREKSTLGVHIQSLSLWRKQIPFFYSKLSPDRFCVGRFRDFQTVYSFCFWYSNWSSVGRGMIIFILKANIMKIGTFFSCADGFYIFCCLVYEKIKLKFLACSFENT